MTLVRAMLALCVCAFGFLGPGSASAQGKVAVKPKPSAAPVPSAPVPTARSQAFATSRQNMSAGHAAAAAGDHAKALKHYQFAWAAVKYHAQGTGRNAAVVLDSIGKAYVDLRQDGQAGPYLREALVEFRRETPNDHDRLATTLDRLASLEARMNNHGQSLQWRREEIIQRRSVADRVQANAASSDAARGEAWFSLANAVGWLSMRGSTLESFDQIEAAEAALEGYTGALETRLAIISLAIKVIVMSDTGKATVLAQKGFRLAQLLDNGAIRALQMGQMKYEEALVAGFAGRPNQQYAQYEAALGFTQDAPESVKRTQLLRSIYSGLALNAQGRGALVDAYKWYELELRYISDDEDRRSNFLSLAKIDLSLNRLADARRHVDAYLALATPVRDKTLPSAILVRMMWGEVFADLKEYELALEYYNSARATADTVKAPFFSEFDVVYLTAGTKILLGVNQPARAYSDLQSAGRSLIVGPGARFGVDRESRRIFNQYRFVFQDQMRAGWIAAHADSAPPSQGASHETR